MAEALTLARPYAKAVFEFAVEHNSLDGWSGMLAAITEAVTHAEMAAILSSPALSGEQQAALVADVCGGRINEKARNLVDALAVNKRLSLMPEVAELFERLRAERQKKVDVEVISAYPLTDEAVNKLVVALKRRLDREVNIQTTVDIALIGGAIIRAGDTVIDGSIKGRLSKLAEALNA
ncbi:MAG TPA: F0F1 ATP synthase subunit delta [Pseudomonadales bacterium]|jgi:F-type H+-transporting ATPase subunit delta